MRSPRTSYCGSSIFLISHTNTQTSNVGNQSCCYSVVVAGSKELLTVAEIALVAVVLLGCVSLLVNDGSDVDWLSFLRSLDETDGAAGNAVLANSHSHGAADNGPGAGKIDISSTFEAVLADGAEHAWGRLGLVTVSVAGSGDSGVEDLTDRVATVTHVTEGVDVDLTVAGTADGSPNAGLLVVTTLLEANKARDVALFLGVGKGALGVDGLRVALVGVSASSNEVAVVSSEHLGEVSSLVKTIASGLFVTVGEAFGTESTTEMAEAGALSLNASSTKRSSTEGRVLLEEGTDILMRLSVKMT